MHFFKFTIVNYVTSIKIFCCSNFSFFLFAFLYVQSLTGIELLYGVFVFLITYAQHSVPPQCRVEIRTRDRSQQAGAITTQLRRTQNLLIANKRGCFFYSGDQQSWPNSPLSDDILDPGPKPLAGLRHGVPREGHRHLLDLRDLGLGLVVKLYSIQKRPHAKQSTVLQAGELGGQISFSHTSMRFFLN